MKIAPLIILYEDINLIIADKGINTVVHGTPENTLLNQIREYMGMNTEDKNPFPAPSNRLDRNTSGPVVFSKNKETAQRLRRLFSRCQVKKTYSARLIGRLETPLFIQADIIRGRHRRSRVENLEVRSTHFPQKIDWFSSGSSRSGTISATVIIPLQYAGGTTIVEIHPWTGRYHQIRVICQAIGYPVYGDKKYNRVPGLQRSKKKRAQWTIPVLMCRNLEIEELDIAVETRFSLEELMSEDRFTLSIPTSGK